MIDTQLLVLIILLVIIQVTLLITALIDIFKYHHYRFGNRIMWILIVVLVNTIGPLLYFVFGHPKKHQQPTPKNKSSIN